MPLKTAIPMRSAGGWSRRPRMFILYLSFFRIAIPVDRYGGGESGGKGPKRRMLERAIEEEADGSDDRI